MDNLEKITASSNTRFDSVEKSMSEIVEIARKSDEKINFLTAQIQMLIEENSALKSSIKMMTQEFLQKIKCRFDTMEQNCFQQT